MAKIKFKINLTIKVFLIIITVLLIIISINTYISGYIFDKEYSTALIDRGFIICNNLKEELVRLLILDIPLSNIEGFDDQCTDVVIKNNLSYAMVVDNNEIILFHSSPGMHDKTVETKKENGQRNVRVIKVNNIQYYEISLPISINNEELGTVRIGFPKSHVTSKTNKLILNSGIVATFSFIFASAILILLISSKVTIPIKKLTKTIHKIREDNNLHARVEAGANNEIGELGESFNKLLKELSKSQNKIKKQNKELEQKVKKRTKELEDTNKKLEEDISIRKEIEYAYKNQTQELSRSNQELEQFAYIASHDLQEPLRMVSSYLQLIKKRYKNNLDKDADEFIDFAFDGSIRMQQLINDLLLYSRVNVKSTSYEFIDLNDIMKKVIVNLKIAIDESKAEIKYDNLPRIKTDQTKILQLFQNLIGNAVKFRASVQPEIYIGVERKKKEFLFFVKDNGIGFENQHVERIFQIFQRLHRKDEYMGTGIGLAVCKKIVEQMGGRIWADSVKGKGSVFYFTIPF